MNVTKEMDVINKFVKDLNDLEPEARRKVIDVVCKILDIPQPSLAKEPPMLSMARTPSVTRLREIIDSIVARLPRAIVGVTSPLRSLTLRTGFEC